MSTIDVKAFFAMSYGVYAVTAWVDGHATGCIANSAMQITSDPATVAVSINHDNFTNERIKECGGFCITVLGESTPPEIIGKLGFSSGRSTDKSEALETEVHAEFPALKMGCSYIVCELADAMETPTHTVFLGRVTASGVLSGDTPMTYAYYHKVIKGKSPKNAPTYVADEDIKPSAGKAVWKCPVCGYVYEGDIPFEELPEGYRCPICSAEKSAFIKE